MSDLTGQDLYDAEIRLGTGRDINIWITLDQKYLELYIGGHEIMDIPDTVEGGQLFVRDIEAIKHHLTKIQEAVSDHLGRKVTQEPGGES